MMTSFSTSMTLPNEWIRLYSLLLLNLQGSIGHISGCDVVVWNNFYAISLSHYDCVCFLLGHFA